MRSKISLDEEAKAKEIKQQEFREELNKTSDHMKKLAAQYAIMVEDKNILSIDLETQDKIIKVANIMSSFMEGQKLVIKNLMESQIKS